MLHRSPLVPRVSLLLLLASFPSSGSHVLQLSRTSRPDRGSPRRDPHRASWTPLQPQRRARRGQPDRSTWRPRQRGRCRRGRPGGRAVFRAGGRRLARTGRDGAAVGQRGPRAAEVRGLLGGVLRSGLLGLAVVVVGGLDRLGGLAGSCRRPGGECRRGQRRGAGGRVAPGRAGVGRCGVDRCRVVAQRLAAGRYAVGPARIHRHRHPVAAAPPLHRDHRHRAPHRNRRLHICPRLQRLPAPHFTAASHRGRRNAGGRMRGRSRGGDLALPRAGRRDDHSGRGPRRRARRWPGSGWPSPGGHQQSRRGDHRARRQPHLRSEGVAGVGGVAGERYRRRSGPRPRCARGHRGGRGRHRRSGAGRGDLRWPDR